MLDFLNDILEKTTICSIENVSIKDPNNLPLLPGLKASIVDIRCTDNQNKHYQIEMQVAPQSDYAQRCQFYTSYFITKQLEQKKPYGVLEPIIFISVVNFDMFDFEHFLSHHFVMDTKTNQQTLNLVEYHFLELSKFKKKEEELVTPVDRWAYFFKYAGTFDHVPTTMHDDKILNQALEVLKRAAWTEPDMTAYRNAVDAELSYESRMNTAHQKGLQEGLQEGILEGKIEGKIEIARAMLEKKFSIEVIAEITGLSLEEIKRIIG